MSQIVITVGYYHYAVPFNAKLAEALATVQSQGLQIDSYYDPRTEARWVVERKPSKMEIRILADEEILPAKLPPEPEEVDESQAA
jgi:hypothetical protein